MVPFFPSPASTTTVSWEGVSISSFLTFRVSLVQIRNSVQWLQTSADGKETHAAKLTLGHLFILQKLASLRNLIMAQQMDKRRTEKGRGEKTQEAKMHSSQKNVIILLYNNPKKRVHHSLLIYSSPGETGAGLWGLKMSSVPLSYI